MHTVRSILPFAVLIAAATACSETSGPGKTGPARIEAKSSLSQTGIVGEPAKEMPTVLVTNALGHPLENVAVTFVLFGGSGSISGDLVTTDAHGIARLGEWILGTTASAYSVAARIPSLEVRFNAAASASSPARIEKIAGDNQVASTSTSVPLRPTVKVSDKFGNPVPGVPVKFEIAGGGGRIERDSDITDAYGSANPGTWVVGDRGPQSLIASSGSLGSTTFAAVSIGGNSGCGVADVLPQDAPIRGSLTNASCVSETGEHFSRYMVEVPATRPWYFVMTSTEFDPYLELRDDNGSIVANNKNRGGGRDAVIHAALPPGRYTLVTKGIKPDAVGSYNLQHFNLPLQTSGCDGMYVMKGTSLVTTLFPGTCKVANQANSAVYRIYMREGASVSVSLDHRSYSAPQFEILTESGAILEKSISPDFYRETVLFTAPSTGVYVVRVYSDEDDGFEYTIGFQ